MITEGYQYDAYGQHVIFGPGTNGVVDFGGDDVTTLQSNSELGNPYMYTGRRLDSETGLYYYRARYMNADQGRFISRDPSGLWADMANIGNGYAYVANNPLNFIDPSGLLTRYPKAGKEEPFHLGSIGCV